MGQADTSKPQGLVLEFKIENTRGFVYTRNMIISMASLYPLVVAQLGTGGFHALWTAAPWVEAATWLLLACFAFSIAWYRRHTSLYSYLGLFLLAEAAAKATPFAVAILFDTTLPFASLSVAMEAGSRAALIQVLILLSEGSIKTNWRRISWFLSASIPPATLAMVLFMPERILPAGLYSLWAVLALHGISAGIMVSILAKSAIQLRRLAPGLVIWALARLVCIILPLVAGQFPTLTFLMIWTAPATAIADLILGLSV